MKKNIILAVVAASALLLSFSCTKQDETPSKTFKAVIERELTKTTVGDLDEKGYPISWSAGDKVRINDATYSAVPDNKDPKTAKLEFVDGSIREAPYTAVFPESLYNSEKKEYEFPRVQKYEEGKLNAPMAAKSKDEELYFSTICAVICFELTGQGTVRQIEITSDGGLSLCGPFNMNKDFQYDGMKTPMCDFDYITLDCGKGVELDKDVPKKFYISLPPGQYPAETLDIRFFDYNGKWGHFALKNEGNWINLDQNMLYSFHCYVKFIYDPEYDPHYHSTDPHSVN